VAASGKLTLKVGEGSGSWQKTLSLADLRDPGVLLADLEPGNALGLLGLAGLPMSPDFVSHATAGREWRAHEDWMQFGHSKVRVYRLEIDFLGQHVSVFISRVGEVLWAELPNKFTLRNEAFEGF
jgi:hypothetical protein